MHIAKQQVELQRTHPHGHVDSVGSTACKRFAGGSLASSAISWNLDDRRSADRVITGS
jgi:hypothetical protein